MLKGALHISLLLFASCASYTSSLGFRAREAAVSGEIERFEVLMAEAAREGPKYPGDRPLQTVLTHFLDLGADPRFLDLVEEWQGRGWIDERSTCAIYAARGRGVAESDPAEAARAADVVVARARQLAEAGDRDADVRGCLAGAPFLLDTSTAALARHVATATSAEEPEILRRALLSGMTRRHLRGPKLRTANDLAPDEATARSDARAELDETQRVLRYVTRAALPANGVEAVAEETAFGAFEAERVSQELGDSFFAAVAKSEDAAERALAWAWVEVMKAEKRIPRFDAVGLRGAQPEPEGPHDWYVCSRPSPANPLAVEVILLRAPHGPRDAEVLRDERCRPRSEGDGAYAWIDGPYPLRTSATKAAATARSTELGVERAEVRVAGVPVVVAAER